MKRSTVLHPAGQWDLRGVSWGFEGVYLPLVPSGEAGPFHAGLHRVGEFTMCA